MPLDLSTLAAFGSAVVLLLISPGPNMAFVLAHGAALGWRGGLAAALGIAIADLILTVLSAFGLTVALASWPPALVALRVGGAAYLAWLAWCTWTSPALASPAEMRSSSPAAVVLRGVLNSLLNPKALIFFVAFLPSFADLGSPNLNAQLLLLGAVLTSLAFVFHGLLGIVGGHALARFTPQRSKSRWPSRCLSAVFAALAIRLLVIQSDS